MGKEMRNSGSKVQRFIEGTILFGVSPVLGLSLICSGAWLLSRILQSQTLRLMPLVFAGALILIGLGMLQFSYLLLLKKQSHLSNGVIYIASIFFMLLGVGTAILLFLVPSNELNAFHYGRAPFIFFIGLLGFQYARKKRSNL